MSKFSLKLIVAAATIASCGIAAAATDCSPNTPDNGQSPSFADLTGVTVTQCAGFFGGNAINSGNQASLDLINSVITTASWGSLTALTGIPNNWLYKYNTNNTVINFGTKLYGDTIVAFHWGNFPGGPAGNVSAIYRFNAGAAGVQSFNIAGEGGLSNAAVYRTAAAIPEPETYALMLAGLGVMGFIARRRKQQA